MIKTIHPIYVVVAVIGLILLSNCKTEEEKQLNEVIIWEIDEPPGLNPLLAFDATATEIRPLMFQSLLNFHYDSYELIPVLAKARPKIDLKGDTSMALTYEIRKEAKWDNGQPITAEDVVFSFKAIATPSVGANYIKPYVQIVDHFQLYPENPKKITIHTNKVHMRAEASTGFEVPIIPKYFYDPDSSLDSYSFKELVEMGEVTDPKLVEFGNIIASEAFGRHPDSLVGSGAYLLKSWIPDQKVVLAKKESWWGNEVDEPDNMYFEANPNLITYQVINDQTAALTALKGGKLDVMRSVKAKDFKENLTENKTISENFNLHAPPMLAYSALGINMDAPIFSSKQTRQAMAHLVNYDRLMKDIMYGYATRCMGPVYPTLEKFYNDTLDPYQFEPEKAKSLLKEDGWKDQDNDGILEKSIDGQETEFSFDFVVNKGQKERETVALIVQEDLRKVGIEMNILSLDWGVVLEKLQNHDFEMMYISLVGDPSPEDYNQLWSTTSQEGGFNFVNFGNAQTDSLILTINRTLDEDQRAQYVKQFQEIIHEQVPYIFLWNPTNRMAINNAFENTHISAYRPGFWPASFTLK